MHVRVPNALLEAEIITLRAIALKLKASQIAEPEFSKSRDHNATSYSTETSRLHLPILNRLRRDHNATSYSTETAVNALVADFLSRRDHNATSYSTETQY